MFYAGQMGKGFQSFFAKGLLSYVIISSSFLQSPLLRSTVSLPQGTVWPSHRSHLDLGARASTWAEKDCANLVCGDCNELLTLPSGRRGGSWDSRLGGHLSTSPTAMLLGELENTGRNAASMTSPFMVGGTKWWSCLGDTPPHTYASEPNKLTGPTTMDCGRIVLFVISSCPTLSKQICVPVSPGDLNQTILGVTS